MGILPPAPAIFGLPCGCSPARFWDATRQLACGPKLQQSGAGRRLPHTVSANSQPRDRVYDASTLIPKRPVARLHPPPFRPASNTSENAAVVCPLQQSLTLPWAAKRVTGITVPDNLRRVTPERFPPSNLAPILHRRPAPRIIPAIPLKPPSGIVGVYPAFFHPHLQRYACPNAIIVERAIRLARGQLRMGEPRIRKLAAAIGHILSAKHPKLEHLSGS